MTAPADLYLEGSDQHRGWFHSSLLTSVAQHDRAPYKAVLTHGFTIDDKGRKMSKSLGNVVVPQKVIGTLGADVLRLWIAATDYANEMALSDEILKRVAESYRRIRNTARFLLGNLDGFDPATDKVPASEMVAVDRWAVWRTQQLQEEVMAAYRSYQFHLIYQKVHNFCSVDLGGFYLDVTKDRALHDRQEESAAPFGADGDVLYRRSAERWLAPILSFTAEEIWRYMPGDAQRVGVLQHLLRVAEGADGSSRRSIGMRSSTFVAPVARELEKLRNAGSIGAPLDAEVDVYAKGPLLETLQSFGEELRFVFITSAARVHSADSRPADAVAAVEGEGNTTWIAVKPTDGGEMRALLAQASGCGAEREPSGTLRALRDQRRNRRPAKQRRFTAEG